MGSNSINIKIDTTPREIEIPVRHEAFEAQIVVKTKARKETVYPYPMLTDASFNPLRETMRVCKSKHYHLDLIMSSVANGKPTILIEEEEAKVEEKKQPKNDIGMIHTTDNRALLIEGFLADSLHTEGSQHKQYALCKIAEVLGLKHLLNDVEDRGIAP